MTFKEALQAMLNGSKVRNNNWKDSYIFLDTSGYIADEDGNDYDISRYDFDSTWSVYDK